MSAYISTRSIYSLGGYFDIYYSSLWCVACQGSTYDSNLHSKYHGHHRTAVQCAMLLYRYIYNIYALANCAHQLYVYRIYARYRVAEIIGILLALSLAMNLRIILSALFHSIETRDAPRAVILHQCMALAFFLW